MPTTTTSEQPWNGLYRLSDITQRYPKRMLPELESKLAQLGVALVRDVSPKGQLNDADQFEVLDPGVVGDAAKLLGDFATKPRGRIKRPSASSPPDLIADYLNQQYDIQSLTQNAHEPFSPELGVDVAREFAAAVDQADLELTAVAAAKLLPHAGRKHAESGRKHAEFVGEFVQEIESLVNPAASFMTEVKKRANVRPLSELSLADKVLKNAEGLSTRPYKWWFIPSDYEEACGPVPKEEFKAVAEEHGFHVRPLTLDHARKILPPLGEEANPRCTIEAYEDADSTIRYWDVTEQSPLMGGRFARVLILEIVEGPQAGLYFFDKEDYELSGDRGIDYAPPLSK